MLTSYNKRPWILRRLHLELSCNQLYAGHHGRFYLVQLQSGLTKKLHDIKILKKKKKSNNSNKTVSR